MNKVVAWWSAMPVWAKVALVLVGLVFIVSLFRPGGDGSAPRPPVKAEPRAVLDRRNIGIAMYAWQVSPSADPATLESEAREACAGRQQCSVMGWTDAAFMATAMPMTDREVRAQVFDYTINRNAGYEHTLFSCDVFTGVDASQCMAR